MISIIIPTLDEEQALPATLAALRSQHGINEVIVCDGGSTDATLAIAADYRRRLPELRVISAPRGRGSQMNAAAKVARGEWLLFLHADTLLPHQGLEHLLQQADRHGFEAGCFTHRFSGRHWGLRLISWLHNCRFRKTRVIYGDQAMFVKASLFQLLGGFAEQQMEDVLFGEKLAQVCEPFMLPDKIVTDSRKFLQLGVWRALFYVIGIQLAHEHRKPIPHQRFFGDYR
ncbi:glycosyltransferase [Exilibacterium tricleocarpae]|uniref:Glycosyltransferase n=1 Tax=Exilibacterium tricleocarpae TaxID=2591008 RepID=A0A545SS43_9GAMM|nr:TIGR04283 family arsenosugar biosynthesis glycosyltransferase [Exilibacterium tricleocarpae]TQV67791.1 glycosyltransferase [Exilibacterium tricleocarpae]